ncbi:PucR C-terminal helix-turn-helix domain-containing protein [Nocardioides alpinus]|uniref:PucR family transcriptional regulator n=2 Tax=Nocardioides TaxID=1839 RepID=A0A4Q2SIX7_9ACTN|nr:MULTISPECIES: PucR family transcriptional regulator [Nocardioides]PKH38512.1 PucR family transcriptional regulator [Nocardioides alpinus]RYC05342.1 PucR family transcriptional regulator [Nocardioides zhouii]SFB47565.1 PucR C-terminal helix-turn-helix domain-containing protein [Nocardioides alpinus]
MSIEHDLRAVADELILKIPAISGEIRERSRSGAPNYYRRNDPMLLETELPSITGALTSIIHGLRNARHLPDGASEGALEEARVAAQAGVELTDLLLTRRIGQLVLWNWILDTAVRVVPAGPRQIAVLKQAAEFHFAWNDRITHDVVATYEQEKSAYFFHSRDRQRRAVVTDLLNGVPTDTEQLGYNLKVDHLAVVAWGNAPRAALKSLATMLDASLLVVEGTGGTSLAWLGNSRLSESFEENFPAIQPPPATYVALGGPLNGVEGFRRGHRQAWQACRVGRLRSSAVTRYRDVALESVVLRDAPAARDFMVSELGPIGENDSRTQLLRETLRAYFETGQNAAATAGRIRVHERTVAYRLKSIEERLGFPINERRDELAVALRLAEVLHDASDHQLSMIGENSPGETGI